MSAVSEHFTDLHEALCSGDCRSAGRLALGKILFFKSVIIWRCLSWYRKKYKKIIVETRDIIYGWISFACVFVCILVMFACFYMYAHQQRMETKIGHFSKTLI